MTAASRYRILVIEDDLTLARMLVDMLTRMGHEARAAPSRAAALATLSEFSAHLALLDLRLPDVDGNVFLPELREYCAVIVVTAYGSIDEAVRTVRAGAADFVVKPISPQGLELVLTRFFQTLELRRDLAYWQAQANFAETPQIIGEGAAIGELRRTVTLFASADTPVLIVGEAGTGKEMAARTIHTMSPRSNARFLSVDCDPGLEAAELFGSWRGGAHTEGLLAAVGTGTIFLSGVDRLAADLQARLLRAMKAGTCRPVGSSVNVPVSARFLLSSTLVGEELREAAHDSDLLQYLSAFVVGIPALRARRGDIAPLARQFVENRNFQRATEKTLSDAAIDVLESYDWPGNVRELGNVIERAIIMSHGSSVIEPEHLNLARGSVPDPEGVVELRFDQPPTLETLRDSYLDLLVDRFAGNRRKIAETLAISERNLYRLLKKDADSGTPD